jgi:hypothetical protein
VYDALHSKRVTANANSTLPQFVRVHKVALVNGDTAADASIKLRDWVALYQLIAAQDETDYDGSGSNGSFVGGSGYAEEDTIVLSDGSVITVDAVSAGAVTEFTVTSVGTGGPVAAVALTQASTSGDGEDFTLTPGTANLETAVDPAVELHAGISAPSTFRKFSEVTLSPPRLFQRAVSLDIAGTNAVGYIYYS